MGKSSLLSFVVIGAILTLGNTVAMAEEKVTANAPATTAELRARIAALAQELADVKRDYQLLLTAGCPQTKPDTTREAEAHERARIAAEQARWEAAQREYEREEERRIEAASFFVKDVTFGITEKNSVFVRFGWTVTVRNLIPRTQIYDLEVQFLDDRGLVVDTDRRYRQAIGAYEEDVIRGDVLIRVGAASRVSKVNAVASRHVKVQ